MQTIDNGAFANDPDADNLRVSFGKVNDNFTELLGDLADLLAAIHPTAKVCSLRMVYSAVPSDNRIIPTGTVTAVKMNSLIYDNGGMYDAVNGRINIYKAGWYRVSIRAGFEAGTAAVRMVILAYKTAGGVNAGWQIGAERSSHAGEYPILEASDLLYLNYGDVLRLDVLQDSGANAVLKPNQSGHQVGISVEEVNPEFVIPVVPLMARRVVMQGDSQTEGNICGPADVAGEWLSADFINRGVSGTTLATIASTKLAQIASDASTASDFILAAGVNDLGYSGSPSIATIAGHIATIINAARPVYRSVTWVVPGKVNYVTYAGNATINANITALVNAVIALGITGLRIVRVDLDATLGMASEPLDLIMRNDGLHYTRKGQKVLADLIYPIVLP